MPSGNLIIIGSSTGGLKILEEMFHRLPPLKAAVVIIQHITPLIDQAFVTSLARVSSMPVSLIEEGQIFQPGQVYLAPGGIHVVLVSNFKAHLFYGERVNSVCPSIDVTMKSVVRPNGGRLAGMILTGMGCDGAAGIAHMKSMGSLTLAQDKNTSVIYGMPKAAAETGKIDHILPTERLADKLRELFT
ncbi:CheB methylesterase domain-containing protein [Pelotalea chapellei]|uniref:protein-glutamate methylesterase n=1 Tax=Pelotalea chapellei TaxID=44671 RepID=A0ABS5UBW8_9BACT|nr:CheB methylesterase domain-containing protein [Pelotalea chapellei]MBT1073189.1 chemotaxis protein CheB [Pelotalea chapellei]